MHKEQGRAANRSVWVALGVIIGALLLGAVLTGDRLATDARAMEYGPLRTVAVTATAPAEWLNHTLRIDHARHAIRQAVLPWLLPPDEAGEEIPPSQEVTFPPPSVSEETSTSAGTQGESNKSTGSVVPEYRNSRPTAASPLVVLISGDSMTEAFGKYLRSDLTDTGVATATHDFRYSSGLTRPDFFDWPAHLRELLASQNPDVVVLMVGANDAQDMEVNGTVLDFGSKAWIEAYSQRVRDTMDLMEADGRRVYWVGQPIARSEAYSKNMRLLDDIYASEAKGRVNVVYVDTWDLFAAQDGTYSAYLIGADGKSHLMRMDDGIHLSVIGAHRLTDYVFDVIAKDYQLND